MKVYFCENNTKGNHYVGAENISHAVRIFSKQIGQEPAKITFAGEILLEKTETNLKVVKDDNN